MFFISELACNCNLRFRSVMFSIVDKAMGKLESHKQDLLPLFHGFLQSYNRDALAEYIKKNSNLPGPRGNLEMTQAFAELIAEASSKDSGRLWGLLNALTSHSAEKAPKNDPTELLPFCGALGIGALGAADSRFYSAAMNKLRSLSQDSRWRLREAVAQALQKLLKAQSEKTMLILRDWIGKENWLQMRAVAATVAEPDLVQDPQFAAYALELHQKIIDSLQKAHNRKSEEFIALRKALGYSISMVIVGVPDQGFAFLHQLCTTTDPDVRGIVSENLKKNRLIKNFPEAVKKLS